MTQMKWQTFLSIKINNKTDGNSLCVNQFALPQRYFYPRLIPEEHKSLCFTYIVSLGLFSVMFLTKKVGVVGVIQRHSFENLFGQTVDYQLLFTFHVVGKIETVSVCISQFMFANNSAALNIDLVRHISSKVSFVCKERKSLFGTFAFRS